MHPPTVHIDRTSPVPLYFQVAQQLEAAIQAGDLPVGDRLGNEVALADSLGLSRPTMRAAIGYLVDKGLVVRQRGIGTTVVRRTVERPVHLTSLFDDLVAGGQRPATQVLLHERQPATPSLAERLRVDPGTEVVHLLRLRSSQDGPLALLRNWLPVAVAGDLTTKQLQARGLYALLRDTGTELHHAEQRIGAKAASSDEARSLQLRRSAPLLTMERLSFDRGGVPVEYGSHVYDAATYSVTLTVQSS